jgi:hypothetical protein
MEVASPVEMFEQCNEFMDIGTEPDVKYVITICYNNYGLIVLTILLLYYNKQYHR